MNKTDLEDLLAYDSDAFLTMGIGTFLLSGAAWLLVEHLLTQEEFSVTPIIALCGTATVAGAGFLFFGWKNHSRKRARIKRIFDETSPWAPVGTPAAPAPPVTTAATPAARPR